jgi:hypothetical protein
MCTGVVFTLLTLAGARLYGQASVFDSSSNKPIEEATVTVLRSGEGLGESETDSKGMANLPDLPPGTYRIRAEKLGYVDLLDSHGGGRLFMLPPKSPMVIDLTPAAVIAGQVFDAQGNPLEGAKVVALVRRSVNGQVRLIPSHEPARSDDRGNYHLFGLPPATYSVAIVPSGDSGAAEVFAPAVYGSFFELKPGETRMGVNLTAAGPQAPSVSGKVSGIPENMGDAAVMLFTKGSLRVPIAAAETGPDGAFIFQNVPPGDYQLTAWAPFHGGDFDSVPSGSDAHVAGRPISIAGADLHTDLHLRPLVKISGRLTRDPACSAGRVVFHPEEDWPEEWAWEAAMSGARFTAEGLPPGRYRLDAPELAGTCRLVPPTLTLPDGAGAELVLALSSAAGEISGTVTTHEAKPAGGLVVLWPADREGDPELAQVDASGRYRFHNVLVGPYLLMPVGRLNSADDMDPEQAPKRGAKTVTVQAGREVTTDLRLVR